MTVEHDHCYDVYGLRVRSDIQLSLRVAEDAGDADVVLQRSAPDKTVMRPLPSGDEVEVVASYESDGKRWYVAFREGDGYRFRFRDTGDFLISGDLRDVRWIPRADGHREEILPVVFAGTILAFLLTLRGHLTLHASAVATSAGAVAIVGHSGRGKSTVAALLAAAGARVVTDDILLVDPRDTRVRCRGSAGELRLRPAAREVVEHFGDGARHSETRDARVGLHTPEPVTGWVDLRAIVVPVPTRGIDRLNVLEVPRGEAMLGLTGFPRIYGLTQPEVVQRQFELLGRLVAAVPVYGAEIPWGPPFDPAAARGLLDLVAVHPPD